MIVGGADGCRAGWVICRRDTDGSLDIRVVKTHAEACEGLSNLAGDKPLGFHDKQKRGGRACEREARKLLGKKGSSVFSSPCRWALAATDYETVRRMPPPHEVGLSKQAFGLFSKLNEVDCILTQQPTLRSIVHEAHPELAFRRMNGDVPVFATKKKADGRSQRRRLLADHGFTPTVERLPGAARDDILDAVACCRTALLIAQGKATRLGPANARDRHGLPMNIWF
ncbi:MAG: DUF429 domain-containing protein [Rhodospirillales bacterium]|nr:DUF429 domain-containing protein [Rhodospirillales bacterium]